MNSIRYSVYNLIGRIFLLSLTFLLILVAVLHSSLLTAHAARNVTFTWSANLEAVDGYRLYYRVGSSGPPYNGTGAIEGSSPVVTGNVTSFTLHGLSETETYYFALTAYRGTLESSYTQEVILEPVVAGNILPVASGASFSTSENLMFSANLSAFDVDGDPLTYSIIQNGSLGSAVISNPLTGDFTYTPSPGAAGNDAFSFKVNDGTGDSNTATVNIHIIELNNAPTAMISASVSVGEAPLLVQFDGTGSTDSDGTVSAYSWDFGDGKTATRAVVSNTFVSAGTYRVKLTVTDNSGTSATATTPVVVTAAGNVPPQPVVSVAPSQGSVPLPVTFDATGSYDPDGSIVNYSWNFDDGTTASGSSVNHVFNSEGVYTVILRITDNQGVSSTIAYNIKAQAEGTVVENKKFPWDLFLPVITRNAALR